FAIPESPRFLISVGRKDRAREVLAALSWAVGEATGLPHPSLAWMAATHGLANALGFGLCSLLAWRRLSAARPRTAAPDHEEVPA
ncbi:YndJ family transporter, partial [Streptomyces sp. Act-28]